ncbi:unnamed protein product [Cylicocyclus nassatus]|uniref:Very-long-chain (3R)-3-hydroxyacyl-CoA dehydratase n=1 Tax=Cylicocyclus nassatus TaxID=53992 RepID=A0AA36GR32_CYLNA|nr:unnamed protein product [Cylicocyclus nassatus]
MGAKPVFSHVLLPIQIIFQLSNDTAYLQIDSRPYSVVSHMVKPAKRSPYLSLYIFLYNVTLFLIHLVIFVKIVNACMAGKFYYVDHFPLFCIGTTAQLLDIIHGLLGITTTSIVAGLIQSAGCFERRSKEVVKERPFGDAEVCGRLAMLFIIEGNPTIHDQITTPILLFAWVLIELFRYPYYALRAWDIEVYPMTWLRYSAWIPLYPLGLLMEWISQVTSIRYYYESGTSLTIPYTDVKLNIGVLLALLAFVCMPFIAQTLLGHMIRQRKNKLGGDKTKTN